MKSAFLIAFGFAVLAGSAAAAPAGGRIANTLYANSLYGIAHPLPATSAALTPYALTPSQKRQERREIAAGVVGNLLRPGTGSRAIGDPHAPWITTGFYASLSVFALSFAAFVFGAMSDSPPPYNVTPFGIAAGVAGASAVGFYIWGITSPINYVHRRDRSRKPGSGKTTG